MSTLRGLFDRDVPAEWRAHLGHLGVPARYRAAVRHDEPAPPAVEEWLRRREEWAVVFAGPAGAGKTHEACRLLGRLTFEPRSVPPAGAPFFWEVENLADWLLHGLGEPGEMRTRKWSVAQGRFLVVDGIGEVNVPALAQEQIAAILAYRYAQLLPTLVTVGGRLDRLAARGWPERTGSQLGQGRVVPLEGRK